MENLTAEQKMIAMLQGEVAALDAEMRALISSLPTEQRDAFSAAHEAAQQGRVGG